MKLSNYKRSVVIVLFFLPLVALSPAGSKTVDKPVEIQRAPTLKLDEIKPVAPDISELIGAMIEVESMGNDSVIGDTHLGKNYAAGALQIRPVMVREVNRILKLQHKKKRYTLKDRFSRQKSIEMFNIWRQFHHPDDDFETIARNWNGGPKGYLKDRTVEYWVKVQLELSK